MLVRTSIAILLATIPNKIRGLSIHPTKNASSPSSKSFQIDYRAANEFIDAHYSNAGLPWAPQQSYFRTRESSWYCEALVSNARLLGVLDPSTGQRHVPTIEQNGFTLLHQPTAVTDFTDFEQIQSHYIVELKQILKKEFHITDSSHYILVWNPVLRGTHLQSQDRQFQSSGDATATATEATLVATAMSTIAGMVHIDTDVGAHETPKTFVKTMYKNRVIPTIIRHEHESNNNDRHRTQCDYPFTVDDLTQEIAKGKRFMVFNFWRNADKENPIIRQSPLGLFLPDYSDDWRQQQETSDESDYHYRPCFPSARPNPETSQWYFFPDMSYDECLVFKQYDRDVSYISDIWHTALKSPDDDASLLPPRTSFDIRVLIVSKSEQVPLHRDRYAPDRPKPQLDEKQAEEYAKEQDKRQNEREQQEHDYQY